MTGTRVSGSSPTTRVAKCSLFGRPELSGITCVYKNIILRQLCRPECVESISELGRSLFATRHAIYYAVVIARRSYFFARSSVFFVLVDTRVARLSVTRKRFCRAIRASGSPPPFPFGNNDVNEYTYADGYTKSFDP